MSNKTQQRKTSKRQNKSTKTNNSTPVNAPASFGTVVRSPSFSMVSSANGTTVRMRGHDVLGSLTNSSLIGGVFDLNPACWSTSRLSRIAATYEKYRYDSFQIKFVPLAPTTATGGVAMYFDPEIYDNIASDFPGVLSHGTSGLVPSWCPLSISFTRSPIDTTTYFCTQKAAVERALLSQGKAVALTTSSSSVPGMLLIDYDITFMYPELEIGYPGEQYVNTISTFTAAAGGVIAAPFGVTLTNIKVVEIVLREALLACFVGAASNTYDFLVGALIYSAWDGTAWRLYPDIASASAKTGPLSSIPGLAAVVSLVSLRKLIFGSI